jgi:hypothetical protein
MPKRYPSALRQIAQSCGDPCADGNRHFRQLRRRERERERKQKLVAKLRAAAQAKAKIASKENSTSYGVSTAGRVLIT